MSILQKPLSKKMVKSVAEMEGDKVKVVKIQGKILGPYGVPTSENVLYLYPEEAVYLHTKNALEVYQMQVLLSEAALYNIVFVELQLIPFAVSSVYGYLNEKGYVVRRGNHVPNVYLPGQVLDTSRLSFDLYAMEKRSRFRKSDPGIPDCRVLICRMEDDVPKVKDLYTLMGDEIGLKVALVDDHVKVVTMDLHYEQQHVLHGVRKKSPSGV